MANTLKVAGMCVALIGALLFVTVPATGKLVEDNYRRRIQQKYAGPAILETESPRFRILQKEYDEALSRLVSGRLADRAIITFQVIIIGALLFGWGRSRARDASKNEN